MMDNYKDSRCLALEKALADETVDPIDLPFWFLEAITDNFSDKQKLGSGGFASVYKGALPNGMVAVKKLRNKIEIQEKDFQREVTCLIDVKHINIVRFLGYCYETQHKVYPHEGRHVLVDKRNMLFCFEFVSRGSLANYLTGPSSGLQWGLRYKIIKGICEGVGYLHQQQHITHMDLKPDNILLDDSMVPKIADLGLSRRFSGNQSKIITENIVGSRGYMAPEFLNGGTITYKADIYSLGVIIIELLMGCKECPNVDKVLESWANTFGTSTSGPLLEQVKLCAWIGTDCMHDDPNRRPDIQDIICRLNETNISVQLYEDASQCVYIDMPSTAKQACKPMRVTPCVASELHLRRVSENVLLDVHPRELCFPFEAKKDARCSLSLINRTNRYVAYFIRPQFEDMYTIDIPISYYNLGPLSTLFLKVKMIEQEIPPLDTGMFEILMISMKSNADLEILESSIATDPQKIDDDLLKRAEELGGEVHVAMLTAVVCAPRDVAPKVISRVAFQNRRTIDVHSTQPWILVGHDKLLSIWYYEMEATRVTSLDINNKAGKLCRMIHGNARVTSVIFIPREEWCVAGDDRGYIHVYTCCPLDEIKRFKTAGHGSIKSLAIHPTSPYLLSVREDDGVIEIWDWENGWARFRKLQTGYCIARATFNPVNANTFVTASRYMASLEVWSINDPSSAPKRITKMKCTYLFWHYDHAFTEAAGQNHVVVLNWGTGAEIWDLQTGSRVHTIREPQFSISATACHPTLPLIAVGRKPAVYLWNSTNYRLEKTVWCTSRGRIIHLGFVGSRRLVIGTDKGTEVLEIDMESLACKQ